LVRILNINEDKKGPESLIRALYTYSIMKAFTLIELLIVVAIIGILAVIAVPNFLAAQIRAKVAHSLSELRTYQDVQKLYLMDNNTIPGHYDGQEEHCPYINLGYLSGPLTDPFMIDRPDVLDTSHQGMYHSTHLRDPIGVQMMNPDFIERWNRKGRPYVIFGQGPGPGGWQYYDISNGLTSAGIIINLGERGKDEPRSNMPRRNCL